MATYSTGISVSFNGSPFVEVQSLSWNYGGSLPRGRGTNFNTDLGTVSLSCIGSAGAGTSNYGTRGDLVISGGGAGLTCKAVYQGLGVETELNGITRYTVTFVILDN